VDEGENSEQRTVNSEQRANIAEGYARDRKLEFIRFLQIARGSLSELDTYFDLILRLGYTDTETSAAMSEKADTLGRMLYGLITKLKQDQ
jgi:four helix bundle protein